MPVAIVPPAHRVHSGRFHRLIKWGCETVRWTALNTSTVPILVLVTMTLIVFRRGLLDPLVLVQEDMALEWEGLHAAANEQIRQGRFPHWNPYGMGGERLYANALLGLFYPGSILF